jgi:L-lactate dehydrogenase complex protein LldG
MSERDNILARIREALKVAAPKPGSHSGPGPAPDGLPTVSDYRRVLPAVGADFAARVALFEENALELKADFRLLPNIDEAAAWVVQLCQTEGWKKVAAHQGGLTDSVCRALRVPLCLVEKGPSAADLESCDAGVSECDALVAQTGSVLVTSRSAGGRALSVLPPHHVVLARREQLVADLPEAFALVKARYGPNYPSMISFITGPSRTGDIERILVLGAHGPKKLTVLCF